MKPLFPTYIIKKQAKNAMQGRFLKALCITAIPSLIIAVIAIIALTLMPQTRESFAVIASGNFDDAYVETVTYNTLLAIQALTALFAFLNVGSIKACLDMLRGKTVEVKSIFCFYNKWYIAIVYPVVFFLVSHLCTSAVNYLLDAQVEEALVMTVAALFDIVLYFITFKLMFFDYALADNDCTDIIAAVKSAWKMTGFNTVINAIVLGFSFIGWFILGVFTMGLAYIFVVPYFSFSVAALYDANVNYSTGVN